MNQCKSRSTTQKTTMSTVSGAERVFLSFNLIRTLHLHSEESGRIPRSSGSWLSDLRLCHLLICLNFCFLICKMGVIVPSLSTSGCLWETQERSSPFLLKKRERNWCFHGACHMPDTVVLTRALWGRSHYWPICRCGAFSSERLFNLKPTELEEERAGIWSQIGSMWNPLA